MCKYNIINDLELKCEFEEKSRKNFEDKSRKKSEDKSRKKYGAQSKKELREKFKEEPKEKSKKDSEEKSRQESEKKNEKTESDMNLSNRTNYAKNEFQEIINYRKEISKMNIFKRKKIAINKYNSFIKNENINKKEDDENIKDKYIKIMCLLLIDNTNKDIVKLYLNFIKNNSNFIKKNKLLSYEKEINNYKIIFTVNEMKQIEKDIKKKSQKDIFLDYILSLSKKIEKKINFEIGKSIKDSAARELNNLFLFNTPIEFDNDELIYYKNYYNIIYETSKQKDVEIEDYLENKKNVIKYILKKDLYNNKNITSNKDKMNLLNIYLLKESISNDSKEEGTVNFNRLIQKIPVTIKHFEELDKKVVIKENFLLKDNQRYFIKHIYKSFKNKGNSYKKNVEENNSNENKFHLEEGESLNLKVDLGITIALENACIQNLFDSRLKKKNNIKMFYNLDKLMNDNDLTPYISDIKKFLKKIVDTKVYQQAIKKLFPNDYNSLLSNNNEEIKQYIDERIKFYPFQNLDLSGITDKLSGYSFIPSINFKIIESEKEEELDDYVIINEKKINKEIYIVGITIVNSIHEVNHTNQIIIFFKGNDKNLFDSPERILKENKSISEGGISLEYLLFGNVLERPNLFECLYILNEKNYGQDLDKFRENFMKITDIVKETKGETEFIKIENGIFKILYDKAIIDIKNLINDIQKKNPSTLPKIYIEKSNFPKDNMECIIRHKCAVFGGYKPH